MWFLKQHALGDHVNWVETCGVIKNVWWLNKWCEQCQFFATYWFTSVPKYMIAYRTNKNCIMCVGVKDGSVVKDVIWLENLRSHLTWISRHVPLRINTLCHVSDFTHEMRPLICLNVLETNYPVMQCHTPEERNPLFTSITSTTWCFIYPPSWELYLENLHDVNNISWYQFIGCSIIFLIKRKPTIHKQINEKIGNYWMSFSSPSILIRKA